MDPPQKKFEASFDYETLLKNLKLTLWVLLLNSALVLTIIAFAYFALDNDQINEIIRNLKNSQTIYFSELNLANLLIIIINSSLNTAILEESLFRYPVLILTKNNFRIRIKYDITIFVIILTAFFLNYLWANGLMIGNLRISYSHPIPWLIFITGLPLYWLIAKTKTLWPAILCHASSNFLLYLFAQTLIYLGIL